MSDNKKNAALFKKYLGKMDSIKKEKKASEIFASLSAGKNSYMRIDRLENSNFDFSWIKEIEDCIYDLGEIISNPKETTKTVTNIVPVELARKTGAESVQHLASHTQYIKEIKEDGDVVPNKILNIGSEEDIHTYENRFIATLVRRLVLFIQKRYEFVKNFSILHDEEILYYKTKSIVDGAEVEIETKIKVKSPSETTAAEMSNKAVERILKIREYVMFFYGSKFMKELKTERDVRNPIVMTNIIRKNPKYNHCYRLFKFLERYDSLGVSFKIDEDASIFNEEELNELNTVMFTNYLALKGKDKSATTKGFSKVYKPKILTSLDDEQFIYGDLLKGPIEFLRVDQGYQEYLDSQLKKDLPPHPTKIEKEYYKEEIEDKNVRKAEKAALDKLEKRKLKEKAEFDKRARAIIAQREKEEAEALAREQERIRLAEEKRIDEVRRQLIEEALSDHPGDESFYPENPLPLEKQYHEELSPIEEEEVEKEVNDKLNIEDEIPQEEQLVDEVNDEQIEEPVLEETQEEQLSLTEEEETPHQEEVSEEFLEPEVEENSPSEVVYEEENIPEETSNGSINQLDELEAARRALMEAAIQEDEIVTNNAENKENTAETPSISENNKDEIADIPQEEEVVNEEVNEQIVEEIPEENIIQEQEEEIQPVEEQIVEQLAEEITQEEPVEEVIPKEEPADETIKEQPAQEEIVEQDLVNEEPQDELVKKSWGGSRSGAGRKKKVIVEDNNEEPIVEEQHEKKSWGGSRSGAGRKKKIIDEPVNEETPVVEQPDEEENVKKSWGGSRAGAGRKKKIIEEPTIDNEEINIEASKKSWGGHRDGAGRKKKSEEQLEETPNDNKKSWGGARSGAGRKKKVVEEEPKVLEKIPGKFIVKTNNGYYVSKNKYSDYKHDAYIFDDFNQANQIKKDFGGKVVKL